MTDTVDTSAEAIDGAATEASKSMATWLSDNANDEGNDLWDNLNDAVQAWGRKNSDRQRDMATERDALAARVAELEAAQVAVVKPLEWVKDIQNNSYHAHCECGIYGVATYDDGSWFAVRRSTNKDQDTEDEAIGCAEDFDLVVADCESDRRDRILSALTLHSEQDVRNEALEDAAANCSDMADKLERNALAKGDPHGIKISMAAILEERATAIRAMKGGA